MNLDVVWSKENYCEFIEFLRGFEDIDYKKFISKINKDCVSEYIGVRTPVLRKIAKAIAKSDYLGFIKHNTHKFYEEKIIHGFIINYADVTYEDLIKMLKEFIPFISSWSLVDVVATKFKQINNNKEEALKDISKFSESQNPWEVRLGLVLILNSYVEEKYIDRVLSICKSVNTKHVCYEKENDELKVPYYVSMANAWLLSECYIKFPKIVTVLFNNRTIDPWTHNRALQKIRDSCRVDISRKNSLKNLKIKFGKTP
ncbi:MAG: DNA alkylation repair protein [Oscillospiraceae bacterium]|jgi:3-methyladenine DNA glycosylase AlkD|nr:DNA alkylation repair protein [Oscillospiraceae bacterium]